MAKGEKMPSQQWEDDPWVGRELAEQVEVLELIGVGAMGRVYRGHQRGIERAVAVKVLHADLLHRPGVMERFHREARVASRLNHPNVVQVLMTGEVAWRSSPEAGPSTKQGVGRAPHPPHERADRARQTERGDSESPSLQRAAYLVMEYLDGDSLASVLDKHGGPLRLERALHIALQVCDAVGEAHDQGIVHRDLKPENVMLVRRGGDPDFVKVLDFGVAKVDWLDGAQATQVGSVFGTARYMAPEAARGELVTPRSDVYSIATLVYQCLAGQTPFDGTNTVAVLVKQCSERPVELGTIAPHVPEAIARVVHRNLSKTPGERCATARELGAALLAAAREAHIEGFAAAARPTLHGADRPAPTDPFPQGARPVRATRVPSETTLIDPELAGTPAGGEPHTRYSLLEDAGSAGPRPTPVPAPPVARVTQMGAEGPAWPPAAGSVYQPTPLPPAPAYPSTYGASIPPAASPANAVSPGALPAATPGTATRASLWSADAPPPTQRPTRARRWGRAAQWSLGLALVLSLTAAGAYVAAERFLPREDSLASYVERANAALALGAWSSGPEGGAPGFVELTDAALARYPGAPELDALRERGARRMAREARRLEGSNRDRAAELARHALRLAPEDDDVRHLTRVLLEPPRVVRAEAPIEAAGDAAPEAAPEGSSSPEGANQADDLPVAGAPGPLPAAHLPGPGAPPPQAAPQNTPAPVNASPGTSSGPPGVRTASNATPPSVPAPSGRPAPRPAPPPSPPSKGGGAAREPAAPAGEPERDSETAGSPEKPRERWL
jgi:serine/threonine-protein kinase